MPPFSDEIILNIEKLKICENIEKSNTNNNNKMRTLSYEDALKEIRFGRVQIEILIASFLILANVMNETMGISFITPLIECEMDLSESDKGLLSGIIFIGIIIPSYGWGIIAGSRGRRKVILWSILGSTSFTILATFMSNFYLFMICRFFTGFFVAGLSIIYTYIGEFCITKHRATIISWASVSSGVALTLMPLTAKWILSYEWEYEFFTGYKFNSWRVLMLSFIAPGVIGGIWIFRLPESPKYLLIQNKCDKALEIVKWIHRVNGNDENELNIDGLEPEISHKKIRIEKESKIKSIINSIKDQTIPLLKPPHVVNFLACCFLQFGIFCIAGGLALFLPDILNKLANAHDENQLENIRICDVISEKNFGEIKKSNTCDESFNDSVFRDSIFLGIAFTIAFITTSLFMKASRRRIIIASTFFASCISGFLLNYITVHYIVVVLFCAFIMLSGINSSIVNGATCDIFPTHLRSTVVCITMVFSRIGTSASSNLIGYLLERNCELTYHILPAITLLCFAISFALPM